MQATCAPFGVWLAAAAKLDSELALSTWRCPHRGQARMINNKAARAIAAIMKSEDLGMKLRKFDKLLFYKTQDKRSLVYHSQL